MHPNEGTVMRRVWLIPLVLLVLTSCREEVPEHPFRIKALGFELSDSLLHPLDSPPDFQHKLAGGVLTFLGAGDSHEFELGEQNLETFEFHLPEGAYRLEISVPGASLYGQERASYRAEPADVVIDGLTDTLRLHVTPTCALILVKDDDQQLDQGAFMIERHSYREDYFRSYPLGLDTLSGLYYTYLTPDTVPSDPSAFLWFYGRKYNGEEGGMPTAGLETGYRYLISVLE